MIVVIAIEIHFLCLEIFSYCPMSSSRLTKQMIEKIADDYHDVICIYCNVLL